MNWRTTAIAGFIIVFLAVSLAASAQMLDSSSRPAGPDDDLLRHIERHHAAIRHGVETGRLPAPAGSAAESLLRELRKYLVRSDAEIQILRIDLLAAKDPKERGRIIEAIAGLSGEMEARKLACLDRLQAINGGPVVVSDGAAMAAPSPAAVPKEPPTSAAQDQPQQSQWRTSDLDIVIEIVPEDLTTGRRE